MAFRGGRGRGRGGFGFGFSSYAPPLPEHTYHLFPKIEALPKIRELTSEEEREADKQYSLMSKYRRSVYFIKDESQPHDALAPDVERYSDRKRGRRESRNVVNLSNLLMLTPTNFPRELIQGTARARRGSKTSSWARQFKIAKNELDFLDKLKDEPQEDDEGDEKDTKKKKGDDDEGEDEENEDLKYEEEPEEIGVDDYTQNFGFDDDEDYLDDDDNAGDDDEATYD